MSWFRVDSQPGKEMTKIRRGLCWID